MKLLQYLKNGVKYVFYGYKPKYIEVKTYMKSPSKMYKDKIVLITGGNKGIGYEIAKRFSEEGAKVIITGRNEKELLTVKEKLKLYDYYAFDICDIQSIQKNIKYIYNKYGKIDVLINNAGISLHEKNILDVSEENYDLQFNTNLKGAYFLTKEVIKYFDMQHQKNLNIIFISSERGKFCDDIPYGLTKAAINSLVQGLSRRFYKNGIRVNAVSPGVTATNLTKINRNSNMEEDKKASGRFFLPEEIAEIVLFISSDYCKCCSGEIIHCDAGNHLSSYF